MSVLLPFVAGYNIQPLDDKEELYKDMPFVLLAVLISSLLPGLVVPIPTLPDLVTLNTEVPEEEARLKISLLPDVPHISNLLLGTPVPIPTFPAK